MSGATRELVMELLVRALVEGKGDVADLQAKFAGLADELRRNEFQRSAEGIDSLGESVTRATEPLADGAKKALAFSAAVAAIGAALAGKVYQSSVSYESELAGLGKVLSGGIQEAIGYGAELDKLALKYAANGQALVQAQTAFVQAGFKANEAFGLVEQSLKLMISGELDAGEASGDLVAILKGFGLEASAAAHAVDALNEVSNRYATDTKQLAAGLAALSPIAKQAGFSLDETAGLLTPIIEVFGSGTEAADALKTGLLRLTDNSKDVVSALAKLGVAQTDANGKMRSGRDIYLDVAKAFQGLDDSQRQVIASQLFGIDQAGRMSVAVRDLGKYLEITAAATDSLGSAAKEVDARLATAKAKADQAAESFRQLSVSLGNQLKPEISAVVGATGEIAEAFKRAVDAGDLSPLLGAIRPQVEAVQRLFEGMARNLEGALAGLDWSPLVDGLRSITGELGDAFAALFAGVDLSTAEGLRTVLQGLVNLLGNFSRFVGGLIDGIGPLAGALGMLFQAVSQNAGGFAELAGRIEGLALSANTLVPIVQGIGSAVFGTVGAIVEATAKIGLFAAALALLNKAGIPVLPMLGGLVSRFLSLSPAVAGAVTAIAGAPGAILALVGASGAAGYAVGSLALKLYELGSQAMGGSGSLGSDLYDLVHAFDDSADAATRAATADELAAAKKARLAREAAAQAAAEKKAGEERASRDRAAQQAIERDQIQADVARELTERFAKLGLAYDAATGKVAKWSDAAKVSAADVSAAFATLGLEAPTALEAGTKKAEAAYADLAASGTVSVAQLASAWEAAAKTVGEGLGLDKTDDARQMDTLRGKVELLQASEKALADGLARGAPVANALKEIRTKLVEATIRLADAARDAAAAADREIEANGRAVQIGRARLDLAIAELERRKAVAVAQGDEVLAAELRLKMISREIAASKEAAAWKREDARLLGEKARALEIAAQADGQYTAAERDQVKATRDAAELAGIEAKQLDVATRAKKDARAAAELLARQQRVLSEEMRAAGVTGVKSIEDLRSAIGGAADGAELERLGAALKAAMARGIEGGKAFEDSLAQIDARLKKLKDDADAAFRNRKVQADYEKLFAAYGTDFGRLRAGSPGLVESGTYGNLEAGYRTWLQEQGWLPQARQTERTPPYAGAQDTRTSAQERTVHFKFNDGHTVSGRFRAGDEEGLLDRLERAGRVSMQR